jgi:hypothetical protein
MELSELSMEFTQEEQVIPETENVRGAKTDFVASSAI